MNRCTAITCISDHRAVFIDTNTCATRRRPIKWTLYMRGKAHTNTIKQKSKELSNSIIEKLQTENLQLYLATLQRWLPTHCIRWGPFTPKVPTVQPTMYHQGCSACHQTEETLVQACQEVKRSCSLDKVQGHQTEGPKFMLLSPWPLRYAECWRRTTKNPRYSGIILNPRIRTASAYLP